MFRILIRGGRNDPILRYGYVFPVQYVLKVVVLTPVCRCQCNQVVNRMFDSEARVKCHLATSAMGNDIELLVWSEVMACYHVPERLCAFADRIRTEFAAPVQDSDITVAEPLLRLVHELHVHVPVTGTVTGAWNNDCQVAVRIDPIQRVISDVAVQVPRLRVIFTGIDEGTVWRHEPA